VLQWAVENLWLIIPSLKRQKYFDWTKMIRIVMAIIFITFASKVTALEKCDILGSLEADPLKKTVPVKFEDVQYSDLI